MKEILTQDLLFGPIESQPVATKPRKILSLRMETASLPDELRKPDYRLSRTWNGEPSLLLATDRARAIFEGSLVEAGPLSEHFTNQFSSLPIEHVRDGQGSEVCVWGESGPRVAPPNFHVAAGDDKKSAYLSFSHPRPFRKETVFLAAFPREEGVDFFWAEKGKQSTNAIQMAMGPLPDYELMYARWHPGDGPFALSDSLVSTFYGNESLALLGEDMESANVTIQREGNRYRVTWFSREGLSTFLKGLVVNPGHYNGGIGHYNGGISHSHLSESIQPGATLIPGSIKDKVVCALLDNSDEGQVARMRFAENNSGTIFGERLLCQGERVLVSALDEGFALAWIDDECLAFALAGHGQKVFGVGEDYKPALHPLIGSHESLEVDSGTEFILLRDGTEIYLVWISKEGELIALAWGAQYPEVLATDLGDGIRLIEGESGHFYLLGEQEVSLCSISGRGKKETR